MFAVGEKVCYPMHGVGVIDSIEEQNVLGEKAQYYVMRFLGGRMTAMIPVETANVVGLREIIDLDVYDEVMEFLKIEPETDCGNWNQRYRENLQKLKNGTVFEVADVVKTLSQRENKRGLSTGERKMLLTARSVLLGELVAASGNESDYFMEVLEGKTK
ncbi:MAG: CarD family transcriptional regulator [Clostridia bacterium]